jgi:outer membrane protein OmpA-like peptidoglycan-associated protein
VDSEGCPLDEDGDGVLNRLDKCPGTPKGAKVDASGCIRDADGDGVDDNNDLCPNTPKGMPVDRTGCIADSDGDGVPDGRDRCSGTPQGAKVDEQGCPVEADADGDGLPDEQETLRKTDPNNPDTDGDQLPDGMEVLKLKTDPLKKDTDGDNVPDGVEVNIQGTDPLVPAATPVKELKRMELAIQFALNSDVVEEKYREEIARAAKFLADYPEVRMTVEGHTDNTGDPGYNQELSERRARSVARVMTEAYKIAPERIRTVGYGATRPAASNDTAEGRAKNRRILAVLSME